MGEGKLTEKSTTHALLREWKGHLMRLKAEVGRPLLSVLEGLEMCGLGFKPKGVGYKKWKKRWTQKKLPKPDRTSIPVLKLGEVLGSG